MDMLLTLWRNIAMIEEIVKIYGIRPSDPNKLKILVEVLNNMVFAETSELALDYLASLSDHPTLGINGYTLRFDVVRDEAGKLDLWFDGSRTARLPIIHVTT